MRSIKKLLCAVLCGYVSLAGYSEAGEPASTVDEAVKKEQEIFRSMMKLVQLEQPIETVDGIKAAQDAYLDKHYNNYEFRGGYLYAKIYGIYIQGITVFNRKGPVEQVFFDMTDIYQKLEKSSDETTRKKVRELMRRSGDLKK